MEQSKAFCFSPKKRCFIEIITTDDNKIFDCELVNLKKLDIRDLLVTNGSFCYKYFFLKEWNWTLKAIFDSQLCYCYWNRKWETYVCNTNIEGAISNLEETDQSVSKNGKIFQIRKVMFKDSIDSNRLYPNVVKCIRMMLKVWKTKGYQITKPCVYLFKFQRILKLTKTIDIMVDDTCKYNITEVESLASPCKKYKRNDR